MSARTPTRTQELFAARARRQRLRRTLRTLLALVVVALIGFLVWLVGWSNVLSVHEVRVKGVEGEPAKRALQVADVELGTPLARVGTGDIATRVEEKLPEAASVEVKRSWPHAVTVEVTPREAVAALPHNSTWWSVDSTGALFNKADGRQSKLPILQASVDKSARRTRAAGVHVLRDMPPEISALVKRVRANSEADIQLLLRDGATVYWGTRDQTEAKGRVLVALIEAEKKNNPASYDVSAPENPAVSPNDTAG